MCHHLNPTKGSIIMLTCPRCSGPLLHPTKEPDEPAAPMKPRVTIRQDSLSHSYQNVTLAASGHNLAMLEATGVRRANSLNLSPINNNNGLLKKKCGGLQSGGESSRSASAAAAASVVPSELSTSSCCCTTALPSKERGLRKEVCSTESRINTLSSQSDKSTLSSLYGQHHSSFSGGCVVYPLSNGNMALHQQQHVVHHHVIHHHHHHHHNSQTLLPLQASSSFLDPSCSSSSNSVPATPNPLSFTPTPDVAFPFKNSNKESSKSTKRLHDIQEVLTRNKTLLENCSWYYEQLSWSESAELLKDASAGSFLVRDSADARFLFSLSVQRGNNEGPTSVRIHFVHGKFRLDADDKIRDFMPEFDSVVALIEHYLSLSTTDVGKSHVWVDNAGKLYSPICLKRPLYRSKPPSLAHFARTTVHKTVDKDRIDSLPVPNRLKAYLKEYPHVV